MRNASPWIVVALILALFGVRLSQPSLGPSPTGHTDAKNGTDSNAPSVPTPDDSLGFTKILEEFRVPGADTAEIGVQDWTLNGRAVNFLIATVPDPLDSSSGHRFDSTVEAIRMAAERYDFVFHRYYYPWRSERNEKNDADTKKREAVAKTSLDTERLYEKQPGMLVFRKKKAVPGFKSLLLVVLLVGESAIKGHHKKALEASLELAQNYKGRRTLAPDEDQEAMASTVHLLAPYFSGSQDALMDQLKSWAAKPQNKRKLKLRFVSGTATAIRPEGLLIEKGKGEVGIEESSFRATTIPEDILFKQVIQYLGLPTMENDPHRRQRPFAFLVESNTGFGRSLKGALAKKGKKNENKDQAAQVAEAKERADRKMTLRMEQFPFPLNVSSLRSSYGDQGGEENFLPLPTFGARLRVPLDEGKSVRDRNPPLHPAMAAVAAERELAALLETLQQDRVRYIAISSTEVKDQLFLAKLVRNNCPNACMIFTRLDSLFSHPRFLPYFKGAIVASTYPMTAKNQTWSPPFGTEPFRLFFPSDLEEGCYNAALVHINELIHAGETRAAPLMDYRFPFAEHCSEKGFAPPIWISLIGQNGPQPLAVFDPDRLEFQERYDSYVYRMKPAQKKDALPDTGVPAAPRYHPEFGSAWILPFFATVLVVLVCAVLFLLRNIRSPEDRYDDSCWDLRIDHPAQRWFYLMVAIASLTMLTWSLRWGCGVPFSHAEIFDPAGWAWHCHATSSISQFGTYVVPGFFGLGFFVYAARGIDSAKKPFDTVKRSISRCKCPPIIFFSGILLLAAAFWYGRYDVSLAPDECSERENCAQNVFFLERTTAVTSGISPLVPVVFLGFGFLWWSLTHLHRLILANAQPSLFFDVRKRKTDEDAADILRAGRSVDVWRRTWFWWLALAFLFSRIASRFVPSVEGALFDVFVLFGLMLFTVMLADTTLLLLHVWKAVKQMLQGIAGYRLAEAFKRLPRAITARFGPFLSTEHPDGTPVDNSRVQQFRLLLRELRAFRAQTWNRNFLDGVDPDWVDERDDILLHQHLTRTAKICLEELISGWDKETVSKSAADVKAPATLAEKAAAGLRTIIEDFVALEFVNSLAYFFVQLRNLLLFVVGGSVLFLLTVLSYPAQPQLLWSMCASVSIIVVAAVTVYLFAQIERDAIVSNVAQTTPDRIDWLHGSFLPNVATYALPLLGILMAMSTDLTNLLHWLDPLLRAVP